jgi:mannonate dehydratase
LLSRRALLASSGVGLLGLGFARWYVPRSQRALPLRPTAELSPAARALVDEAFAGLDRALLWDVHAHVLGLGTGASGMQLDPRMQSHLHPIRRLQYETILAASGIEDRKRADEQYLERLLALQRAANPAGRLLVFAFDRRVDESGAEEPGSPFYVPDEHVLALARAHPEIVACASVHPYRKDALERLERAAAAGARAVKWLPNSQGMDPLAPRCADFYRRMRELGLVLISHTGVEHAVEASADQELGNPLRLRGALEHGVRTVAAHCASLGKARDLDRGGEARGIELFLRMAREDSAGLFFGDISAVVQVNRSRSVLDLLLGAEELHARLVNGSDYPLAAVGLVTSTRLLVHRGQLAAADRAPLEELFDANPLLYDFVLKRRLRLLREGGRPAAFAPEVFESGRLFV